jgi:hypothetical protein
MSVTQISSADGTALKSNPGFVLRKDAANAWERAVAAFGKRVLITGAWRSYETQERIFRERYRAGARSPFGDYRYWPKDGRTWGRVTGAAAAVPGTSNHGGGVAVDVKTARQAGDPPYAEAIIFAAWGDVDRVRFLKVAKDHGWADDEGRSVGELWHLTYYPERDKHKGEAPTKARTIYFQKGTKKADQVKVLQRFLRRFAPGLKVDGDYGDKTVAAVKTWQAKAGFKPTGKIGDQSLARLRELDVF